MQHSTPRRPRACATWRPATGCAATALRLSLRAPGSPGTPCRPPHLELLEHDRLSAGRCCRGLRRRLCAGRVCDAPASEAADQATAALRLARPGEHAQATEHGCRARLGSQEGCTPLGGCSCDSVIWVPELRALVFYRVSYKAGVPAVNAQNRPEATSAASGRRKQRPSGRHRDAPLVALCWALFGILLTRSRSHSVLRSLGPAARTLGVPGRMVAAAGPRAHLASAAVCGGCPRSPMQSSPKRILQSAPQVLQNSSALCRAGSASDGYFLIAHTLRTVPPPPAAARAA